MSALGLGLGETGGLAVAVVAVAVTVVVPAAAVVVVAASVGVAGVVPRVAGPKGPVVSM